MHTGERQVQVAAWVEGADISVKSWASGRPGDVLNWSAKPISIHASVTQNRSPVRGANVTASVYAGPHFIQALQLKDGSDTGTFF